ncbi:hypothetical protein [Nocardia arizonensis]|uniref:hypothetical protein n=1 Tax=Nocardia arizonensis TaxID=1141647 RepID=UPI000A8C5681|nr:hypothetical protein [Nocardia arizonensis]
MQTLIVAGVVAVVLLLVFAVVQFASRPPQDVSRWDSMDPGDLDWDDGAPRIAD